MKVLIVDDNEDNRILQETILTSHGYTVESAVNGVHALRIASRFLPDIIISDILMPEMDGYELCRAVRKDEQLKHIPFVFYTASYTDPKDKELAIALGASRYIVKPIETEEFLKEIEVMLKEYEDGKLPIPIPSELSEMELGQMHEKTLIRKLSEKVRELETENAERKKAEYLLKLRAFQQREISEIGKFALTSETELTELMDRIVSCIVKTLDVEYCKILELLPDGKKLLLKAGFGWKDGCVGKAIVGTEKESQAGYTLLSSSPIIVSDLKTETRFNGPELLHDHGVVSGISTIIYGMDVPYGVLGVHTKKKLVFTKDDVNFVQSIANILAEAIKRKQDEALIKASLEEKELLLAEVYHRTRNNMNVICSLLRMQSEGIKEEKVLTILKEIDNRIRSMSLVHSKLYQSKDLSNLNLNSYIKDLVRDLFRSYLVTPDKISLKFITDDVPLAIDYAIPCGLAINEIITNSLKHAFPEKRKGEITINLRSTDKGEIELKIADNGIGMPKSFDIKNTDTLGLKLVFGLLEQQLGGKIKLNCENGVEFLITFKGRGYTKRV